MALVLLDGLRGRGTLALDDFEHSLQTATRAERAGADAELVVAALLHDAAKAIVHQRHGRVAADILAGSVRPEIVWLVRVHSDFTALEPRLGGRHARYRHVLHPGYQLAKRFVDEWDLPSRDPAYDSFPVEHFVPLVRDVLGRRHPRRRRRPWRRLPSMLDAARRRARR